MRLHLGLLTVVVASSLVACSGQHGSAPATTSKPRMSTATSISRSSTPEESPTASDDEAIRELIGFTSPSGNVGCFITSTNARCDISERDWTPPPRPADCEFDYGQGISLSPGESASFVCAGDTTLGGGDALAYGKSLSAGPLICDSAEAGITCRDVKTGHGFTIARQAYRLF